MKEKGEGTVKQDASTRNTKSGRASIEVSQTDHPSIYASVILRIARSFVSQRGYLSLQWTYQNKETCNDRGHGTSGYEEGEERDLV